MENLAPNIYRQRLTIEATYTSSISWEVLKSFLKDLATQLHMTPLTEPFIFSPDNTNHPIHHWVAWFMAWAESGCSIYTRDKFNFLTVEIYTCKKFEVLLAVDYVKNYFSCDKIVFGEI